MNFRIFIRICLIVQIIAVYFSNNTLFCVESVRHISPDVNYGWLLRLLHANGTRLFFICLYLHVERWLQFNPFYFSKHMNNRCVNYNCCYSRSFLGYMVPWGQISFWGSHWYYQFIFNYSLHRGRVSSLNVWGGVCSWNPYIDSVFSLHFITLLWFAAISITHLLFFIFHWWGWPSRSQ